MQLYRRGSNDVVGNLGLGDIQMASARTTLARKLNDLLAEMNLSQTEAAELLGIPQPKISAIRNYRLEGISLERLMEALTALGQRVEIKVSPSNGRIPARIQVAA